MAVSWGYYDDEKFEKINDKYLPNYGEGETKATQIVTAVNKLIYKWYNDGDVYDNTYYLSGWANDLSSYANWLDKYVPSISRILHGICKCFSESDYEDLLKDLADKLLDEKFLEEQNKIEKIGSIYECRGTFEFIEIPEEEEWDDDEWED